MKTAPPRMPKGFLPILGQISAKPFISYMGTRGFDPWHTMKLAKKFDLRYCKEGPFQGRIIFPIKRNGDLMNWTGRTVIGDNMRYRSHTTNPELAKILGYDPACENIANLLLWHDHLEETKAKTLVICEGPFDALKVNHLGLPEICATCLFTHKASDTQIELLRDLIPKFKSTVLLLDQKTFDKAVGISLKLPQIEIVTLPKNVKDPGEITSKGQLIWIIGTGE